MRTTIILFSLFLLGACEDIFEVENPNSFTDGSFYKTEEDAVLATNAAYSSLQKRGLYGHFLNYVLDALSDEAEYTEFSAGIPEGFIPAVNYNANATNTVLTWTFRDLYNGVYRANAVLDNVADMDIDVEIKNRCLGEAHFLRGLYHWHAIMLFGPEVPIVLRTPADSDDFFNGLTPAGEAWAAITNDFKRAKELLPTVDAYRGTGDLGRASKGAATGYLGKTYLYRASLDPVANSAEMYQNAADEFVQIINQEVGTYNLTTNFRDNHTNENEHNIESLFEVAFAFTAEIPANNQSFVWSVDVDPENRLTESRLRAQNAGMFRDIGGRWYNIEPSQKLYDEFERGTSGEIIDPRAPMTLWSPGGAFFVDTSEEDTLYYEDIDWNGRFGWRKFEYDFDVRDCCDLDGNGWVDDINQRLLRYSDVLLMYAEALSNGASGSGSPQQYLNIVRSRANQKVDEQAHLWYSTDFSGADREDLPSVEDLISQNGWSIQDAIRHERMVELSGELHRWFDIVRWNRGALELTEKQDFTNFDGASDYYWPIPFSEFNRNPNISGG
ncbi:MAG: RagB/SusD family nutrient uptake outer membrane protein [Bacteroidota bacterium]